MQPEHIKCYQPNSLSLKTKDLKDIGIAIIDHNPDEDTLSAWAKHIRNHYCLDEEIDELRRPMGLSRKEYLEQLEIPDNPPVVSGDFAEILIADYIQYFLNYLIPRTRYEIKENRNVSTPGTDILGFKILNEKVFSKDDELLTCEVKAALVGKNTDLLKNALDHCVKDMKRKGESLNAMRQRLKMRGKFELVKIIERFQDKTQRPYKEISCAAIVCSEGIWEDEIITNVEVDQYNIQNHLIVVIRGIELMDLARKLYERACNDCR